MMLFLENYPRLMEGMQDLLMTALTLFLSTHIHVRTRAYPLMTPYLMLAAQCKKVETSYHYRPVFVLPAGFVFITNLMFPRPVFS